MRQSAVKFETAGAEYAVTGDFCRIFTDKMNGLYQLSFLLTGDASKAEQCFVAGLDDCAGASRVFKEWAHSWARRAIVQNAIRLVQPARKHAGASSTLAASGDVKASDDHGLLSALPELPAFERFVFVMSVLEQYSDQDCKTLLGCSRQDVVRARAQALKHLVSSNKTLVPDMAFGPGRFLAHGRLIGETA